MPYTPTPEDLTWARTIISLLKDGGTLVFRVTGLAFRVDKKNRVLMLIEGDALLYLGLTQQFIRTYYVFKAIGWEVTLPPTN